MWASNVLICTFVFMSAIFCSPRSTWRTGSWAPISIGWASNTNEEQNWAYLYWISIDSFVCMMTVFCWWLQQRSSGLLHEKMCQKQLHPGHPWAKFPKERLWRIHMRSMLKTAKKWSPHDYCLGLKIHCVGSISRVRSKHRFQNGMHLDDYDPHNENAGETKILLVEKSTWFVLCRKCWGQQMIIWAHVEPRILQHEGSQLPAETKSEKWLPENSSGHDRCDRWWWKLGTTFIETFQKRQETE